MTATASLGYLRTRPASVDILGSAVTGGLQLSHPLIRSYVENLYLTGSVDGVNSDNALFGQTFSDERTRAVRFAAAYTKSWPKTVLSASLTASLGLDALGAREVDHRQADPSFGKLNGRWGLDQQIAAQWVLRLRAAGQYSGDPLPSSEQFTPGGQDFGRAFESAIVVGDEGAAGSRSWRGAPEAADAAKGFGALRLSGWRRLAAAERPGLAGQSYDLASTGVGARVPLVSRTVVEVELDHAIDSPVDEREHGWRVALGLKGAL